MWHKKRLAALGYPTGGPESFDISSIFIPPPTPQKILSKYYIIIPSYCFLLSLYAFPVFFSLQTRIFSSLGNDL
jgi:hypothetical protein